MINKKNEYPDSTLLITLSHKEQSIRLSTTNVDSAAERIIMIVFALAGSIKSDKEMLDMSDEFLAIYNLLSIIINNEKKITDHINNRDEL